MSDVLDRLRALDPERDGSSGAPPLGWLRALLDAETEPRPRRGLARLPRGRRMPRTPHRRPIAVAVALACLAALVAVAIAVLGGGSADPRREALVPAHGDTPVIVHVVARTTTDAGGRRVSAATVGGTGTNDGPVERWAAGPQRWRQRDTLTPARGLPGGAIDSVYAGGVLTTRNSWERGVSRRRLTPADAGVATALSVNSPDDRWGAALLGGAADPRAIVAAMIRDGEARRAGETTRNGRRLLRLFGERPRRRGGRATSPAARTTWLVDAETYVPVERNIRLDTSTTGRPTFLTGIRTVFDVYETLPLNSRTALFLRLGGPTR